MIFHRYAAEALLTLHLHMLCIYCRNIIQDTLLQETAHKGFKQSRRCWTSNKNTSRKSSKVENLISVQVTETVKLSFYSTKSINSMRYHLFYRCSRINLLLLLMLNSWSILFPNGIFTIILLHISQLVAIG